MTELVESQNTPKKILLATDLSARCDRALERALSLAASWQAQLTILHVFEENAEWRPASRAHAQPSWQRPPDAALTAKLRIRQSLRTDIGDATENVTVLVEEGDPPQVIERVAAEENHDLVITGIASERPFARQSVMLGKTVERLLRTLTTPVLIVLNRARAPYEHILATTDLSANSGYALEVAMRFFPDRTLQLLHAFDAPYSGLVSEPARYEQGFGEVLAKDVDAFLDSLQLSADQRRRLNPLIERGRPEELIPAYVRARNADLVVLGTQGRGAVLEALIGSTAKKILETLQCDALVARAPG